MTSSFKFHLRPSSKGTHVEGKLFIRVICNRRYKNLSTVYSIFPAEWDITSGRLILPDPGSSRFHHLKQIEMCMREDSSRLRIIISLLEEQGDYTVEDVTDHFKGPSQSDDLLYYSECVGDLLRSQGRLRTSRAYRSAVKSLISFSGGKSLKISEICSSLMHAYQKSLTDRGLYLNTISFYMRNLRALYHRAICEGIFLPNRTILSRRFIPVCLQP